MKILCLLVVLFLSNSIYSQKRFNIYHESLGIGVSKGFGSFHGNNFIAKSYNSNNPFTISMQFQVYKNIGVGYLYQHSQSSLKSTEYVGISSKGKFGRAGVYGCYYSKLGNRFLVVPKVGGGFIRLRNILDPNVYFGNSAYDYKTWGMYYSVSSDIDYFVTKGLSLFTNLDYSYLDFKGVNASTANGVNYNSCNFFGVQLGVKFWAR